tara:strand:+ start:1282 stop:1734 length:453 start_codon:yes stop_codon:yes gene_type:complete
MYKKLIFILCILLTNQCGYSPIYNKDLNKNINIKIIDQTGDIEFNKKLYSELKQYLTTNSKESYDININSLVNKKIISKDTTGKTTSFEINVNVIFEVTHEKNNKIMTFSERLTIKNIDDTFEQRKYENIVKNNFAKSIKNKLIMKLNTM